MRILTITNLYPPDVIGGYEIACEQMVKALRARGHDVLVLTSTARRPVNDQPNVIRGLRLTEWYTRVHRGVQLPGMTRAADIQGNVVDSSNVAALLDAIKSFEPDLVYMWNTLLVGALGIAGALAHLQLPTVWHLMDAVPRSMATIEGNLVTAAPRAISRRLRARYLACSQRLVDEISSAGFEFDDRIRVVPNWVDPMPKTRDRSWYPDAGSELRMVAAGQLAPHKGFDLIVEMARRLLDHGRGSFEIDFIGGGMNHHYRRLILENGLAGHVHMCGSLEHNELIERFWNYDVFLFPTWSREPFAFAPLEAAARGCVPVISRECGNAEWCVDGVHCLKVGRDVKSLVSCVSSIMDGKVSLGSIGRRGSRQIRESFSLGRVADAVEDSFSAACRTTPVRPGKMDDAYYLARLGERLALDWAENTPLNQGT